MVASYRIETQMFLMPSLITMSIAATRMYRSVADFGSSIDAYGILSPHLFPCSLSLRSPMDSEDPAGTDYAISSSKPTFTVPTPPKQMEMAMKTSDEKHPTSLTDDNVFYIVKGHLEQLCDRSPSVSVDDDVESIV